ncbi:MAG: prepilin peptidase [Planctomycetes bacterium]|nr:prepilin peptidase [Planctomycetota bacterium]
MAETDHGLVHDMLTVLPPAFWVGFFVVLGTFVGSFINVVVYRLPRNCLSINNPRRSFCPSCKTQLSVRDNLPVIGWVLLRGRCRYCGVKYGARYPLVELLVGVLFGCAAWSVLYGDGVNTTSWTAWLVLLHVLLMISVLVPWALIDLDLQYIPDSLTFVPLLIFLPLSANAATYEWGVSVAWYDPLFLDFLPRWLNSMASALATGLGAMLFLMAAGKLGNLLFRRQAQKIGGDSMGWADVKIMLLLGVMLGWPKMVAGFFVAIALGSVVGIIARVLRGSLGVPFGPFLAAGALAAMLLAPRMEAALRWYFSVLEAIAR